MKAPLDTVPELFAELPPSLAEGYDPQAPWALLGEPLDRALADLPSARFDAPVPPDVHLIGDRISIGAGTRILPGAILEGPLRIGRDCLVRGGAYLRGGVWVGDRCVIGASTEVKRAILLDGAKAPHLNYVGDSVLGQRVNLGAGTILSNFRHDGGEVLVPRREGEPIATGRRKLGALLGDDCMTGCNDVLNPGTIVGRGTRLYPGLQLRAGLWPAGSLVKLRQQLDVVELTPRET